MPIFEGFWHPMDQYAHIKGSVIHRNDRLIKPYQDQKKKMKNIFRNHGNHAGNSHFLGDFHLFDGFWGPMQQWKHIYGHVIHQNDCMVKHE